MDLETRDQRSSCLDGGSDMKRSATPESLSPPGFASSAGGSSPPLTSTPVSTSVRSVSAGAGAGSGTSAASGGLVVTVPLQHESATGKPAVPVHCIVELSGAACQELGQPTQEIKVITDGYAILPSNTTLNNLVTIALEKLGIYGEATPAKGALQIKNWKPLGLEQITENPSSATVGEILSDLGQLVTLRITLLSLPSVKNERPEEPAIACQTVKREEPLALPEETSTDDLKESSGRDLSTKDLMLLNQLLSKTQQHQQQLQQQQQQQQQQQLPLQQQQKSRHSTDRLANQLLLGAAALQNHMQIAEGMPVQFGKGHELFNKTTITENGVSDSMYQTLLQSFSNTDKRTPCGSGMFSPERRDEILRTFIENAPKLSQGPGAALPAHLVSRKRPNENEVLDFSTTTKLSNNVTTLALTNNSTNGVTKFDEDKLHASKPRVRTTFDPETEVPQLHAWFQKDQHPTRVQIQDYVEQLNAARRALSRDKLLNVNNVVYWFKNARAAYKRRRLQGSSANQLASQSSLERLAITNSPSSMRGDMDSEHEGSVSPPPTNNGAGGGGGGGGGGGNNKLLPVSQAALSVSALQADDPNTPLLDKWKEFEYQRRLAEAQHRWQHIAAVMHAQHAQVAHQTLDLSVKPGKVQSCSSEAENDSADSSKEGCPARNDSDASEDEDNDAWENRLTNAQASSLALYGAGMYNNVAMPVVPFQSGINVNPNAQLEASGRKRNRTFIDPVSEVPKLERWFSDVTTHPHHAQIEEFTAELNSMEYRQKFPKLEPRNVQFWFKNRRAKYKRIEKSANSTMETTVTS